MASVLITGTSKGIGLETALAFGRAGYKVFATMRNPSASSKLAETAAEEKLDIAISAIDVDSDDSVRDGIAAILKHGPIDVLVNNAGVETVGSVEETPLAEFRSIMETNYFGVVRCVQAVAKQMRERQSGCIINVSSVAGRIAAPPFAAYCASKWALEAMTEALAGEMKTFGVRVALVEPGIIDTAMAQRISKAEKSSAYRQSERYASLFAGALQEQRRPTIISGKILEIAQNGTWTLRHIVGPGAAEIVALHNGMTDEEAVSWNAADDETYFARFG